LRHEKYYFVTAFVTVYFLINQLNQIIHEFKHDAVKVEV